MALKKIGTNSFDDDAVTSATLANSVVSDINTGVTYSVPSGGIIMWSGATNNIPTGWVICDGQNGTPDLRNRFVIGATAGSGDTTYPGLSPNATGGSADAIVVEHNHTLTDPGHSHTEAYNTPSTGQDQAGSGSGDNDNTSTQQTSTETTGITIDSAGSSGTNANLPPYMALAYIMKT